MFKKAITQFSILILTILLTGCSGSNQNIAFKEDAEHEYSNNYTYKFIGESEHFYFETGKVYYNNDERELLISNFKVKDNVDKTANFSINLYFNDKLLYGDDSLSGEFLTRQQFENTVISEHGTVERNQNGEIIGESDSFLETTEDNFKESIQLETKYCIVDHCETEILQLKYMDE